MLLLTVLETVADVSPKDLYHEILKQTISLV